MNFQKILYRVVILCLMSTGVIAETINYEGSSTIGKFISDAKKVYTTFTFKINTVSESLGGEQCIVRDQCDIGGVARDVNQKFLDKGIVATLIGKDAIAAIVNVNNPITGLSSEQLRGIFSGDIKNWSDIGGENLSIKVLVVKSASATRRVFAKAILGHKSYKNVKVVTPDAKMLSVISRDKGAIGQMSLAFLAHQTRVRVKALRVDGQIPSVNNPNYPITRNLHIVTQTKPKGKVKTFLDWTLSPQGQEVIKQRFVGIVVNDE